MDQNSSKNFLGRLGFFVELAALIVVGIYTYLAYQQKNLTQESLQAGSRPYIQVVPIPTDLPFRPTANEPLKMRIDLINTDKLPARTQNRSVVTYSREHLANPGLSDESATRWVWGGSEVIIFPTPRSSGKLSTADITNMKAGKGWVYVSVESVYGNNSQY